MYKVQDSYGTNKTAWTKREALSWLAACSPQAFITHRLTGKVVASRSFVRI